MKPKTRTAAEVFCRTAANFARYGDCYPDQVEIMEEIVEKLESLKNLPPEVTELIDRLNQARAAS